MGKFKTWCIYTPFGVAQVGMFISVYILVAILRLDSPKLYVYIVRSCIYI